MRYILKIELRVFGDRSSIKCKKEKGVKENSKVYLLQLGKCEVTFSDLGKTTGKAVGEYSELCLGNV